MPTPPRSINDQGLARWIGQERYDYLRDNLDAIESHVININALAREWNISKATLWRWIKILKEELAHAN